MKKQSLFLKSGSKYRNSIELTMDDLPEDIRKTIQEIADKKKANEEEEEHEQHMMTYPVMMQDSGTSELEQRGVLILDREISKVTLSRLSAKLLSLHFNEQFNDTVQLVLNSPGGYLDAAWAFIDIMDSVRMPIRTIAMGEIVSAAAMIFVAGDERVMAPNSSAMIHHFSTMTGGSYPDLVASRKGEDQQARRIVDHFLRHSKYKTAKQVEDKILLAYDNWLSPKEMKEHGLCDVVLNSRKRTRRQ